MRRLPVTAFALVVWLGGCGTSDPSGGQRVSADDNYRSPIGAEFDITGDVTLRLTPEEIAGDAEQYTTAAKRASDKVDAITKALDARLLVLWPEEQRDKTGNGLVIMLRSASSSYDALTRIEDGVYGFTYHAEAAGPPDLLTKLGLDAGNQTTVTLGSGASAESLVLAFAPSEVTRDAYPKYLDLFADGLDVYIHFGGDHNTPRNDLDEAQAVYGELVSLGLTAPAAFADLKLDSGPFTGSIDVAGSPVAIRVKVVHEDMVAADQHQLLLDAYKEGARTADIVIYRGHAGTELDYSGVAVSYNPRLALPTTEFRNLDLPAKYQIFVYDGCETYTGYADQLYLNPAKTAENADVITSVNFGSGLGGAETVRALLKGVLTQRDSTWLPLSWDDLLKKINDAKTGSWLPIYGVHGIADNPKLSPLADPTTIGRACEQKSECPGVDSLCVQRQAGGSTCAAACADDVACPSGTTCRRVQASWLGDPRQCL